MPRDCLFEHASVGLVCLFEFECISFLRDVSSMCSGPIPGTAIPQDGEAYKHMCMHARRSWLMLSDLNKRGLDMDENVFCSRCEFRLWCG